LDTGGIVAVRSSRPSLTLVRGAVVSLIMEPVEWALDAGKPVALEDWLTVEIVLKAECELSVFKLEDDGDGGDGPVDAAAASSSRRRVLRVRLRLLLIVLFILEL
jgi:hypothetical protein